MRKKDPTIFYYFTELNQLTDISVYTKCFSDCVQHRHDFFEFEYVLEGTTICCINGHPRQVFAGDLIYVTPADVHSYIAHEGDHVKTITVHFHSENLGRQFLISELEARIVRSGREIEEAFLVLQRESQRKDVFTDMAIRNALERILLLFLRNNAPVTRMDGQDKIGDAIHYINQNFNRSVELEQVCEICGYSPSYFCRRFKETTGYTFLGYLNKMRLTCAEHLLTTTQDSALQICYDSGFGSVRNFNREFKKKHSVSPLKYREQKSKSV